MQAVILAAGFGKRLQPITESIPKCLVPVNGKPLLTHTLEILESRGICEVILVVGHMKDQVYQTVGHKFGKVKISYVENDIYDKTNNVYSLWLAKDRLDKHSLLLECDLYYEGELIDALVEEHRDCNVLVSKYDASRMDGTVVALGRQNVIKRLITKRDQDASLDFSDKHKTVNMYYFSATFLQKYLVPYLDLYVSTHGVSRYYELVLGVLVYLGEPEIHAVIVDADKWCEIDDEEDLHRAEKRFGLVTKD